MAKPVPIKSLSRILATDIQIAAWHDRMQRELRLTAAVRRLLPRALADRVRVLEAAPPAITLTVAAGAIAAVIRQRSPDLLAGLRRDGWDFTELQVRVQVQSDGGKPEKHEGNQRLKPNSAPLAALAQTLPKGPLRDAIEKLVRRTG